MRGAAVLIIALLFLIDLGVDLHDTREYGGIDLRDKVVAGRLLLAGQSPYTYHWRAGDPEGWLDPNANPAAPLSRYTGTPAQSLAFATIGWLPFGTIKVAWTAAQYLLFLVAVGLLSRRTHGDDRLLVWGASVVLVLSTAHWHLHVERGQMYMVFGFLLVAALFLAARGSADRWALLAVGMLLAVLAVFKPPYALIGLPFLLARRWYVVVGAGAAAAALLVLFLVTGTVDDWTDYSDAMRQWAIASSDTRAGPPPPDQPIVIEGLGTLRSHRQFEVEDASVKGIVAAHNGPRWSPRSYTALTLLAVAAVLGIFARRYQHLTDVDRVLLGFTVCTLAMICLPAPRYTYQLVQWIGPLLVVVRDRHRYSRLGVGLMVGGSLSGLRAFAFVPHSYMIGEIVMLIGLLHLLRTVRGPTEQAGRASSL